MQRHQQRSVFVFFSSMLSLLQQRGELWVIEKLKGEREVEAERADRGSDRCSGPEEARTCDRLTLTRPFSGKKKKKEKRGEKKRVAMVTGGGYERRWDGSQAYLGEIISFDTVVAAAAHTSGFT